MSVFRDGGILEDVATNTHGLLDKPTRFSRSVGAQLKAAMDARGINQTQLAELSGVPRQVISQIVSGKRNTTMKRLEHLFDVLDHDLAALGLDRQSELILRAVPTTH